MSLSLDADANSSPPGEDALLHVLQRIEARSPEQFVRAVRIASEAELVSERGVQALRDAGLVTPAEVAESTAAAWGVNAVDLNYATIDPAARKLLPLSISRRHGVLVIGADEDSVTVVTTNPGDVVALDDVRSATGRTPFVAVAPENEIESALDRYEREENSLEGLVDEAAEQRVEIPTAADSDEPVVRYVASMLEQAVSTRASDIHIEPQDGSLRIRYRIDGVLHEIETVPQSAQAALISRVKVLSSLDIAERRVPQNGRITIRTGNRSVDLRVATLPTVWGEKVVLRVLDSDKAELDLRKLGFSDANYTKLDGALSKPHGMVLVTGPTGSGKSTSLYAALSEIGRPEVNIITVEDPVEYRLAGANQVQINTKAGLTFAAVLPAILRSDPDVVLIGEIRDRTTAQLAVEAALTGHLVLSTLHTNDAPSAISRLVEMGIEPFLLGASLEAVMAQRLTRRLCEWCKEAYEPGEEELLAMGYGADDGSAALTEHPPEQIWRAVGCRVCSNTGYKGRLAIHEIMPVSDEIERLTVGSASTQELRDAARAEGMRSLREDGMAKVLQGLTSTIEVLRVAR